MSLFRKPRVGDVLETKHGVRYSVIGFEGDQERTCLVENERGQIGFVWAFLDGSLNEWFSLIQSGPT